MDISKLVCKPQRLVTCRSNPQKGHTCNKLAVSAIVNVEVYHAPRAINVDFEYSAIVVVVDHSENTRICNNSG